MNEQQERAIVQGLRALAATTKDASASPHVEQAVLAEMGRQTPAPAKGGGVGPGVSRRNEIEVGAGFSRPNAAAAGVAPSPVPRRAGWFGYAAAALLLVSLSGAWFARESAQRRPGPIHPAGFVAIPNAWTLPPMESGSIVRVALPVTILPQYGLAILPDAATHMVDAEFLVAQDGLPRMIRLAQDDSTRSTP
jgi:hypothetical protein